jgi:phage/conjugal plasmid C-4 type zinc finger TraR family protein
MDEIDRAQSYQEEFQADALRNHQRKLSGQPSGSRTHCEECGEEIPLKRRELVPNCRLCIACQTEEEIRLRRAVQ